MLKPYISVQITVKLENYQPLFEKLMQCCYFATLIVAILISCVHSENNQLFFGMWKINGYK